MICFLCFGAYVHFDPFEDRGNDGVARLCQVQIFFSLLASVAISAAENTGTNLDVLLTVLWFVPVGLALLLESPILKGAQSLLGKWTQKQQDEDTDDPWNRVGLKARAAAAARRLRAGSSSAGAASGQPRPGRTRPGIKASVVQRMRPGGAAGLAASSSDSLSGGAAVAPTRLDSCGMPVQDAVAVTMPDRRSGADSSAPPPPRRLTVLKERVGGLHLPHRGRPRPPPPDCIASTSSGSLQGAAAVAPVGRRDSCGSVVLDAVPLNMPAASKRRWSPLPRGRPKPPPDCIPSSSSGSFSGAAPGAMVAPMSAAGEEVSRTTVALSIGDRARPTQPCSAPPPPPPQSARGPNLMDVIAPGAVVAPSALARARQANKRRFPRFRKVSSGPMPPPPLPPEPDPEDPDSMRMDDLPSHAPPPPPPMPPPAEDRI